MNFKVTEAESIFTELSRIMYKLHPKNIKCVLAYDIFVG